MSSLQAPSSEVTEEVIVFLDADLSDDASFKSACSLETFQIRQALYDLPSILNVVHGEGLLKDVNMDEVRAIHARALALHQNTRRRREPGNDHTDAGHCFPSQR